MKIVHQTREGHERGEDPREYDISTFLEAPQILEKILRKMFELGASGKFKDFESAIPAFLEFVRNKGNEAK